MTYQYFNIIFVHAFKWISEKAASLLLQQANATSTSTHYHAVTKLSSASPPFVTLGE